MDTGVFHWPVADLNFDSPGRTSTNPATSLATFEPRSQVLLSRIDRFAARLRTRERNSTKRHESHCSQYYSKQSMSFVSFFEFHHRLPENYLFPPAKQSINSRVKSL